MSARCPKCGARYGAEARFCPQDGTRLVITSPIAGQASPVPASRRTTEPVSADRPEIGEFARMAGQLLEGRYRVERKIGEGGMSFVYLATDLQTSARVAIKILSPQIAHEKNAMARLRREAELAGRLQHPNVCHIAALGQTEGGMVFVVMPFVEGELLCDRTMRLGHITLEETVRLVRDISAGLEAAHQLGIIHRDLKPENILIDRYRRWRITDFGVAKIPGEDLAGTTGTPEFAAPEQLLGEPQGSPVDCYAMAAITVFVITGKPPYGTGDEQMILARELAGNVDLAPYPPEIGAWVERGLDPLPDNRFADAAEMHDFWRQAVEAVMEREQRSPWWRRWFAVESTEPVSP